MDTCPYCHGTGEVTGIEELKQRMDELRVKMQVATSEEEFDRLDLQRSQLSVNMTLLEITGRNEALKRV